MRQAPGRVAETVTGHRGDTVTAVPAADAPVRRRRHQLTTVPSAHTASLHRRRRAVLLELFRVLHSRFFLIEIHRHLPALGDTRRLSGTSNVHDLDVIVENMLSVNAVVTLTAPVTTYAPVPTTTITHEQEQDEQQNVYPTYIYTNMITASHSLKDTLQSGGVNDTTAVPYLLLAV